jgi:heterodisulfide reductase subunit B
MKLDYALPVLYFTQLLAIALGAADRAALNKNLIDPRPVLQDKGMLAAHDRPPAH